MSDPRSDVAVLAAGIERLLEAPLGASPRAALKRHRELLESYARRADVEALERTDETLEPRDYLAALRRVCASPDLGLAAIARRCLRSARATWPEHDRPDSPRPLWVVRSEPTGRDGRLIVLGLPAALRDRYSWLSGQHVTVTLQAAGLDLRRSYSICAPASRKAHGELPIAVRRAHYGLASAMLVDEVRSGTQLEVEPPEGAMTWPPGRERPSTALLVAGGSGVTPLYAIAADILSSDTRGKVALVMVERRSEDVMLREQLLALSTCFPGRFTIEGIWTRGPRRRPAEEGLAARFAALRRWLGSGAGPPLGYVCGPEALARAAISALRRSGWDPDRIQSESFLSDRNVAVSAPRPGGRLRVALDKGERDVELLPGETLLTAMLRQGIDQPFSCLSGTCGTCRAVVVDGAVTPDAVCEPGAEPGSPVSVYACIAANAVEARP